MGVVFTTCSKADECVEQSSIDHAVSIRLGGLLKKLKAQCHAAGTVIRKDAVLRNESVNGFCAIAQ
eukprot:1872709-Prymnesium_polylepis.1